MSYETFFNISEKLMYFIENRNTAFADFGYCVKCKLIEDKDIDYFRELKQLSKKAKRGKLNNIYYLHILVCMLIIIKYPDEVFENLHGEKTLAKYLTIYPNKLYERAKGLNQFMSSI